MRIALTKHAAHINDALQIAISLPEYFTKEAIKNMEDDFKKDYLIIAEDTSVEGFLCFGIRQNRYEILWMAVKKDKQSQGIGKSLLEFLISHLKNKNVKELYAKTLSPEESYAPYERTRKFYEEEGFQQLYIEKANKK